MGGLRSFAYQVQYAASYAETYAFTLDYVPPEAHKIIESVLQPELGLLGGRGGGGRYPIGFRADVGLLAPSLYRIAECLLQAVSEIEAAIVSYVSL